jgi:hypothetical protein
VGSPRLSRTAVREACEEGSENPAWGYVRGYVTISRSLAVSSQAGVGGLATSLEDGSAGV